MDEIKKKFQIIVARYEEDIAWLLPFKNITIIYNKGKDDPILNKFETIYLNNYGRESHTYLYHIITNYDNLADKTIFFQGKINDHKVLDIEDYFGKDSIIGKFDNIEINKLKKKIDHYGKYDTSMKNGTMKISNYTPYEWLINIIGINLDNIESSKVIWGANFSLSKDIILSKPKKFYENILRYINYHKNPEEGHYLERSWYLIFNQEYISKNKVGYLFLTDNFNKIKETFKNVITNITNITSYSEIHLWVPLVSNIEYGIENKISYTPNNNKYLTINPSINNNEFYLNIKGSNDAHILIESTNENKYEIVLGGWNNLRSVIRDYNKNKIINSYEGVTLDKNNFIKFNFEMSDNIIIKSNDTIIFNIKNIYPDFTIKNIKIKSYFNADIYWDYDHQDQNNFKLHLCDNIYYNIDYFYQNNYTDYYTEKLLLY